MTIEQTLDLGRLAAGMAVGLGTLGGGLGLGIATKGVLDAIARQPEIKDEAFKNFILGAGLADSLIVNLCQVGL